MEDVVETLIKFNSQTAGRDRFFRLLQYSSKFIGWMVENWKDKDLVAKLRNLEYTFAAARKLLRFGRTLDAFYAALGTLNIPDLTLRTTITLSRINFALYLLADHITWLRSMGLTNANQNKWSNLSNRFWLYQTVMNLVRDFYEILQILSSSIGLAYFQMDTSSPGSLLIATVRGLCSFMQHNKEITVDTIKNGCDFWLPYNALGHSQLSSGAIGLLGIVSSIAAILPLIDPSFKLVPS